MTISELLDSFASSLVDHASSLYSPMQILYDKESEFTLSSFTPRESAPTSADKAYTVIAKGGYNVCIEGNPVNRAWYGSVLPNCTGYVHGRWIELGGKTSDYPELSTGNAKTYYANSNVEKSPSVAREGAIMVWTNNKSGHVAIVEKIIDENTIYTSESDYGDEHGGTIFVNRTRKKSWNWGTYPGYSNTFIGFLYHPNISPTPIPPGPTSKKHKMPIWMMIRRY